MRIFLTGASGMVGKNILEHKLSKRYEWLIPNSKELDLLDAVATYNFINKHQPDFIIHAAAKVGGIQAHLDNPSMFLFDNLDIGKNIVLGASQAGVKKLLNISSACVYPANQNTAFTEEQVLSGLLEKDKEGYALAKAVTVRMCGLVNAQFNYKYKSLIACNLFGRWDKFDPNSSHMISAAIRKIENAKDANLKNVEIWGNGEQRREFMFAEDFADFIFFAIENYNNIPDVLNVGSGEDHTINYYYENISKIIGYTGEFQHNLHRPAGTFRRLLDCSRLSHLNWKPQTPMASGISKTYDFFLEQNQ